MKKPTHIRENHTPLCALEASSSFHEAEDLALVKRAQRGDQSAFEELLKGKLRLIEKVILEFASSPLTFDDFYRIGKETLHKSIQIFDERRGTRFNSFAYWGLKGAFQRATDKAKQKSSSFSSGFSVLGEALTSALGKVPHKTLPIQDEESNQIHDEDPAISSNEDSNEETMSFSLDEETPHIAHTRPISFNFLGKKYLVNSWIDFLVQIATFAYAGQHGELLKEATSSEIAFTTRYCIGSKPDAMIQPKRIGDDLWIEGCFNAKQLVDFAKWITWWCNIDEHSVRVSYEKKNALRPRITPTIHTSPCVPNDIPATTCPVEHIGTSNNSSSIRLSDQLPSLSSTKPTKLVVSDKEYPVSTWREVMIGIAKLACKRDNGYTLKQLLVNGKGPIGLRNSSDTLHTPAQICEGLWIESQHNSNYLILISQKILEAYNFNTSEVSVDYGPTELARKTEQKLLGKATSSIQKVKQETLEATPDVSKTDDLRLPQDFVLECSRILSDEFPRGMRRDSVIDRNKFCRKYESVFGKAIPEELKELTWKASSVRGLVVEDKVFPLKDEAVKLVKAKLETLLSLGIRQGYYAVIFEDGQNEYCDVGIGSAEVLAGVIRKLHPEFEYNEQFFRIDRSISVEDEIVRVLGNCEAMPLEELCSHLPGMPRERILQVCHTSTRILSDDGKYILEERLDFAQSETEEAVEKIRNAVRGNGYALLREVHLEISETLNNDISQETLRQGFFQRFLSHEFKLKNGIISDVRESLSVRDILLKYSQNRSSFTLTELNALYKDLTGDTHIHGDGLAVAHRTAFQVDDDHFIQPNQIEFDTEGIDDALASMLQGGMKPLLGISTFISFPAVSGYQWNHYLLASYLRLVSERFGLLELTISNCCNALIVPKANISKDYCQAVAEFLLQENVPLDFDMVGRYSTQKGLLARARKETVSAILSEMQRLTGGR